MSTAALRHLGPTQQALLRHLLQHPDGVGVEALCDRLRISHNAVRQHLSALVGKGWVERCASQPTGGRPQARWRLAAAGHALFPRNYGLIAGALMEGAFERLGTEGGRELLVSLGRRLGAAEPAPATDDAGAIASALAARLDTLGYEAVATDRGGSPQIEAFNCVFHSLAARNPDVCRFDLAFMEAATGRRIHHMECIVRGGHVCRFRIGESRVAEAQHDEGAHGGSDDGAP